MLMKNEYVRYYYENMLRAKCNQCFNYLYRFTGRRDIFNRKQYSHKNFIGLQQTNDKIAEYISSGNSFLVARYGGSELKLVNDFFSKIFMGKEKEYLEAIDQICELSGFFPNDEKLADRFVKLMLNVSRNIDLLGIWNLFMEDFLCERYAVNAEFTKLRNLEPYYVDDGIRPWSCALKNKKVLVIHPFTESIERQYEHRTELWKNEAILPQFELKTIQAVQTLADQKDDRFADWFQALEYMTEKSKKMDFDIALIGCGAYGLPLAAEIKRMGKGAIHMGGALQILFGIRGNRWDDHPVISQFYNDAWIRPVEQMPKGAERVEDACYW